jgi:hypothetical protein
MVATTGADAGFFVFTASAAAQDEAISEASI